MRYIMFNKPYGVLSQFTTSAATSTPTLKDYIDVPNVYAAGRLDRDSEGLLILTDDGLLIRRITDPIFHLEKTYYALVEGVPEAEALNQLEQGIQLKDYKTNPASFRVIPAPDLPPRNKSVTPHGPTSWLEVRISEGKKRQIRHMTAKVGLYVLRLVRIAIGPLDLGSLEAGQWRDIHKKELELLR